jgi:AraC-like DNA-binding protein
MSRSTNADDYQSGPLPVLAMAKEFAAGAVIPRHSHPRAQLLYGVRGVMRVTTPVGAWVAPPRRAVWLPPGVPHEVRMASPVAMRTLYVDPGAAADLPEGCAVIEVSDLLRALILEAVSIPIDAPAEGRAALVMALILTELRLIEAMPLHLPTPTDPRLVRLCAALTDNPADDATLEIWGERVGASARTLNRLFLKETGGSFAIWRAQARLIAALELLGQGQNVARVAAHLGYASASAFTAMFRRALGATPARYFE